jgi:ABC-type transporter Mla MlaB component
MSTAHLAPAAMPLSDSADQTLRVARRDRRRGTTLTLTGRLDPDGAEHLARAVRSCLDAGRLIIDLDFAGLTPCDVSALPALHDVAWLTVAAGGRLRQENPCTDLVHLLTATTLRNLCGPVRAALRDDDDAQGFLVPAALMAG